MFSKINDDNKSPIKGPLQQIANQKPVPPSLVSSDVTIIGDLRCDGEIQIDGKIDGDIKTKTLEIGKTASIKGEIVADKVRVNGTVNGRIKARSVELFSSAHVVGDIMHEDLSIETGAFLEGHCMRNMNEENSAIKPSAKKS